MGKLDHPFPWFFFKNKMVVKIIFLRKIQFRFVDPKSDWLLCALYVQEVFWICNALFESSRVFFWVKLSGKIQTLDLHSLIDMNYIFTLTKYEIFTKFYVNNLWKISHLEFFSETKIYKFDITSAIEQQIFRLQITIDDSSWM